MTRAREDVNRELRIGSLCTGYGGLDLAVHAVLGGDLKWLCEFDAAPAQVCEVRFPGVSNLHDLTALNWQQVPPVDVLTAGYPCQPFSHAGARKGTHDHRHLWPYIADALGVLRPRLVVLENVAGHLSLGFDVVLGDLARLGFDAEWCVVRASDVGGCHQRARLFILAANTNVTVGEAREHAGPHGERLRVEPVGLAASTSDTDDGRREQRHQGERHLHVPVPHGVGDARVEAADADRSGLEGPEPAERHDLSAWGGYGPAIERHARALGRPAPSPVDEKGRLNPRFVEWMMMLPDGWVTDVLTSRTKALKCLGNGVVPPQAAYALSGLLARLEAQEVAA